MSRNQRIVFLAIAAVILILGIAVIGLGSSDSGSDDGNTVATATQPAETQAETAPEEPQNPAATEPVETTEAPPPPRVETVRIRDGGPAGEPRTIEFGSGDTVRLRFTSNTAQEVHIHGYDKYVDVPAGGSARTRFKADAEGIFEIEAHATGEILAKLKIQP